MNQWIAVSDAERDPQLDRWGPSTTRLVNFSTVAQIEPYVIDVRPGGDKVLGTLITFGHGGTQLLMTSYSHLKEQLQKLPEMTVHPVEP